MKQVSIRSRRRGSDGASPGVHEVIRRDRPAVAPAGRNSGTFGPTECDTTRAGVAAQPEHVLESIGARFVMRSERSPWVSGCGFETRQPLEHRMNYGRLPKIARFCW